ncbi:hypothetical protein [Mucilaginibacter ginsenosidivorax]|uniref:Uncharacterized protein n=1 Tax=Mucilaginibacter ginsenosidivorax TaxID=862126 RepID=A0A5B8W410_9SPHI|nr:hypothetical protein [Mucilaginibacter ginsenosidivorax]QEC78564.1 hypothetical protein FSB76_22405 [Mucilaginibacter ginsenosidivorax]
MMYLNPKKMIKYCLASIVFLRTVRKIATLPVNLAHTSRNDALGTDVPYPGLSHTLPAVGDIMKQVLQPAPDFAKTFRAFVLIAAVISLIGLLGLKIVDLNQRIIEPGILSIIGAE